MVSFPGSPTVLADDEFESPRSGVTNGARLETHPYLKVGRKGRLKHGPWLVLRGF